jgi:hypothetical protein
LHASNPSIQSQPALEKKFETVVRSAADFGSGFAAVDFAKTSAAQLIAP